MYHDDIRVSEVGDRARDRLKAVDNTLIVPLLGAHHLDRDGPVKVEVLGPQYYGHPAVAEFGVDPKPARKRLLHGGKKPRILSTSRALTLRGDDID